MHLLVSVGITSTLTVKVHVWATLVVFLCAPDFPLGGDSYIHRILLARLSRRSVGVYIEWNCAELLSVFNFIFVFSFFWLNGFIPVIAMTIDYTYFISVKTKLINQLISEMTAE